MIGHYSGDYGWNVLFYNSFLGGVTAPADNRPSRLAGDVSRRKL